ncbi:ABC transporter permease [Bradyrhizobium sp. CCGUVB1N3]|uniref:ABC transporter permease n=1 Tax=Bradyrhizobium sp. CCGUVB1N3 TaxID=2949629 RepID=UPI0020B321CF|nr:ABC transporter permease [Bradyrhizobium sp. CCGUVB1N3]MCP3473121.1 ABC transporter permease [Bradyrhizobium sp. CCGUVB1N3]
MPNLGPFVVSGLATGAVYALSAVGIVVLFRASGVVNLAQGAIGALSAIIAWQIGNSGSPPWIGWIAGIAAAIAVSLGYGRLLAPRVAHSDPVVRAVATLGLALVLLGLMDFFWGEYGRVLRLPTDSLGIRIMDVRVTYTRLIAVGLTCVVTVGTILFLGWTRMGLAMRALANRREISALLGVPVLKVDSWAWVMSGLIAGVSGILLANLARMQPLFLTFMVIPAIAAAIAGRVQSLGVAVIGGLAIGAIEAIGTPIPAIASYRTLAPFVFAVVALIFLQRHGQPLIAGGIGLGADDIRSVSVRGNSRLGTLVGIVAGVIIALVVALATPELASSYWLRVLTASLILALGSLATGILYAQLGMVSLCQFALVGVGGWVALRTWHAIHWPFELSLLCGGIGAALFGLIFGLPALRMRGLYLALATLMIAGGFQVVITAIDFPDGGVGFIGKVYNGPRLYMGRPQFATTDAGYFRYCLATLVAAYLIVVGHQRSRVGRAWAMMRRSEACALSASVNIVAYKIWAFVLAGFLAGICGGLLAGLIGTLDLTSFPASESILLFAVTVIGGAYSWLGPILAGLLLRAVPGLLNDWHIDGNVATIIFGAGLLHALITAPRGIAGQILDTVARIRTFAGEVGRGRAA